MKRTRALKLVNSVQNPSYSSPTVRESKKVSRKLVFDGDNYYKNKIINHLTSTQDEYNDTQIQTNRVEHWVEQQAKHTKQVQKEVLNTTELILIEVPPDPSCYPENSILFFPSEVALDSNAVTTPAVSEFEFIENVQKIPNLPCHSATLGPVPSSEVSVNNAVSIPTVQELGFIENVQLVPNLPCHPATLRPVPSSEVSVNNAVSIPTVQELGFIENVQLVPNSPCNPATLIPVPSSEVSVNNAVSIPTVQELGFIENVQLVPNSPCNPATLIPVPSSEVSIDNVLSTPAKSEPEYIENVHQVIGGRKRNIINKKKLKQLQNNKISTEWTFNDCGHTRESKKCVCKVYNLSFEDMNTFRKNISTIKSKIDQDKYVLTMVTVNRAKDTRRHSTPRAVRTHVEYYLPSIIGERIPVCATVFSNVTSFTRRRLNLLTSTFKKEQKSPTERRGGSRLSEKSEEVTDSIKAFIMKMKCRKSHYARNDTGRSYLPPEMSVKSLWEHWKEKRIKNEKPVASISKFHYVFTNNFNLSFGHPRQDVCSNCTELITNIKLEKDMQAKAYLKRELYNHKENAKIFPKMMSNIRPGSIHVSFDMMQNQPLPKLSVTDTFYSRQIWLYNLTFVINSEQYQSPENCYLYTWLENESGRGPNEVCSALLNFLEKLEERLKQYPNPPTTLNLFSDSCSAQNKNQFVVAVLLYYINCRETVFQEINHIFPVRGHSYMPPDQVFGRIEKCLRNKENMISPTEYYTVFEKFTKVHIFNKDFFMYDFKKTCKNLLKPNSLKTTEQKIFKYQKGKNTVGLSSTYNSVPNFTKILKRNANLKNLGDVTRLDKTNHIKPAKRNDVKKLMKYFVVPEDAKDFYKEVCKGDDDPDHDSDENDIPCSEEDE